MDAETVNSITADLSNKYDEQQIFHAVDHVNARILWNVNSICLVYSRSSNKWFNGKIMDITTNPTDNNEWLIVRYKNTTKQIQRFCLDAIKPVLIHHNNENNKNIIEIIQYILNTLRNDIIFKSIDLPIFKSNKIQYCYISDSDDTNNIIHECSYLLRISQCLKYHQTLSLSSNYKKEAFIEFINETYTMFMDDYIHLMEKHSDHIITINGQLKATDNITDCNIKHCQITQRRYTNRERNNYNDVSTNDYSFCIELFDIMHFYLVHLVDTGMRVNKPIKAKEEEKKKDNNNNEHVLDSVDYTFKQMTEDIKSKQKQCDLGFNRLNGITNSKFSIKIINNAADTYNDEEKQNTFIDNMMKAINNPNYSLQTLFTYIKQEAYDTDSIIFDIAENKYKSNIFVDTLINNSDVFDSMYSFIKYYQVSQYQFSTGIIFWYWAWYKNINDQQYKEDAASHIDKGNCVRNDEHDLCGYSISDLFVEPFHDTLKTEALESGYINITNFDKLVIQKGDTYYNTKKMKKIECDVQGDPLHFEIDRYDALQKCHIYSLILYCDFTEFSTEFSRTFRPVKWNESISSIKARHSHFYHTAKQLREMIQYYGIRGTHSAIHGSGEVIESGPFYTGMDKVLNIGSFSIRLNGPTSTSKHIEVATRFAKRTGMIIQLNNKHWPSRRERFFNCNWISAFPEEDERIFCGGRVPLEIESIRVIESANNYRMFFKAFHLFDMMVSGQQLDSTDVTRKDILILSLCINHYLDKKEEDRLEQYVTNCFYLFAKQKQQIKLDLYNICNPWRIDENYKEFVDIIHLKDNLQRDYKHFIKFDVLKPLIKLSTIFENLKQIIIYSTRDSVLDDDHASYTLDVSSLLSVFQQCKGLKSITIKALHRYKHYYEYWGCKKFVTKWGGVSWLGNIDASVLHKQFATKSVNVEAKTIITNKSKYEEDDDIKEDWLIMSASS